VSEQIKVAYHQGPETMTYAGRHWRRGDGQLVSREEFEAIKSRNPANPYQFLAVGGVVSQAPAAAKPASKSTRRKS